jgi:two-component sensor histidine kinase
MPLLTVLVPPRPGKDIDITPDVPSARRSPLSGMRLARALAQQTGAELRTERQARGTEFVLEIPVQHN